MIARRVQTSSIGYNAIKSTKDLDRSNLLQYVNAQDLRTFGLNCWGAFRWSLT